MPTNRLEQILLRESAAGLLAQHMERAWALLWENHVPAGMKETMTPENVEIVKRFFMLGFTDGALWAQEKGRN